MGTASLSPFDIQRDFTIISQSAPFRNVNTPQEWAAARVVWGLDSD